MFLAERLNRLRFETAARAMRDTPPIGLGDKDFAVLSMVQHKDVMAYLLAIKTFASRTRPGRIVVIADPTLDSADIALIRRHVRGVEIRKAETFQRPALPVGGTWERLAAIAALNAESSIVQLDSDTVTLGEAPEVVEAACAGRSFVLRPEPDEQIVDLATAAIVGRGKLEESRHIQAMAEARLTALPNADKRRYVRGCSGFTGFGRGAVCPASLDDLSGQMRALHGKRWDEWGSEQVASNLLAASAPGAFMLPHPRYCNADHQTQATALTHYIGYVRFTTRAYERQAREAARSLARTDERLAATG
jgi:hypothetical protein